MDFPLNKYKRHKLTTDCVQIPFSLAVGGQKAVRQIPCYGTRKFATVTAKVHHWSNLFRLQ